MIKWENPALISLTSEAEAQGRCASGSGDSEDCDNGMNAGTHCDSGTNPGNGICYVGTGGAEID